MHLGGVKKPGGQPPDRKHGAFNGIHVLLCATPQLQLGQSTGTGSWHQNVSQVPPFGSETMKELAESLALRSQKPQHGVKQAMNYRQRFPRAYRFRAYLLGKQ